MQLLESIHLTMRRLTLDQRNRPHPVSGCCYDVGCLVRWSGMGTGTVVTVWMAWRNFTVRPFSRAVWTMSPSYTDFSRPALLLCFLNWAYVRHDVYFLAYGTPGYWFSAFSYASLPIFGVILGLLEAPKMYKLFQWLSLKIPSKQLWLA